MKRSDLRPSQLACIDFIKEKPYCAVWLDMRQGKTVSTLTAIQDLYEEYEVMQVLVIAPLRVSINSWPQDLKDWEHLYLDYELIRGTPAQRLEKLKSPAQVHIINREMVSWLVEQFEGKEWPYDCVVLDESRSFKNHTPKTPAGKYTRFGAIRKVRPQIRRLIELTGTPAPRNYFDLYAQIFLLDGGKRLGKNITAFRNEFCDPGREHYIWHFKDGATEEIERRIADIVFSVKGVKMPSLPPNDIAIELPKSAKKAYRDMVTHSVIDKPEEVVALDAGARMNKALQICAGSVYHHEDRDRVVPIHQEKMKALDELLECLEGNVLIVYNYKFEKTQVLDRYPDAVVLDSDPETVNRWNRGEISKLVLHPASGGHGLNLWRGGNDIVWLSPTHDQELYSQVNMRLSHPDKTDPPRIHRLLVPDSVETQVVKSLSEKDLRQKSLIEFVLSIHENRTLAVAS